MRRFNWLILLALLVPGAVWAQNVNITIGTAPQGAKFTVDGTIYNSPQAFMWPAGSSHIVNFPLITSASGQSYQPTSDGLQVYTFGGWTDNAGLLSEGSNPTQIVTADPGMTSLIATVSLSVQVHLQIYTISPGDSTCSTTATTTTTSTGTSYPYTVYSGQVYLNGTCYSAPAQDIFLPLGAVTINAFPFPGWAFAGWIIAGGTPSPYLKSINITQPTTIIASFQPAKRVHIQANPPGLTVLLDGASIPTDTNDLPVAPYPFANQPGACTPDITRVPTPIPPGFVPLCIGDYDFVQGSTHTIGATIPQSDTAGNYWVFEQFSNGSTQNGTYTADNNINYADVLQANFSPGVHATFLTNPGGFKLMVDGRDNWPTYNFIWGVGDSHTVAAEPVQSDATGRVWTFQSWSNGGPLSQPITVPSGGMAMTAAFARTPQVQVTSIPAGLTLSVNGASCVTPCSVNLASGSQVQLAAPASIPAGTGTRYDFLGWSDGGAATHTVTLSQDVLPIYANYQTSYQLTAGAIPSGSATFNFSPASPDGYFANGTQVTVTASASNGYKFVKWTGALSTTQNPGFVVTSAPLTVIANTTSSPYIPPAGIETAAGPTPDGSVAPGSLISIFGQNLAMQLQLGPASPLSQTVGGVTVTVGTYLLPLMFVSPTQINAQLPTEVTAGSYPLTVSSPGQPNVNGTVTVSRDAPALFQQQNSQNLPLVLATHQDGSPITLTSPAVHGETITIYGTGFGPYNQTIADGFATPSSPVFGVTDPVSVQLGSASLTPASVTAAPGMVGIVGMQVAITSAVATNSQLSLTVTVNGKASSSVMLPVQ